MLYINSVVSYLWMWHCVAWIDVVFLTTTTIYTHTAHTKTRWTAHISSYSLRITAAPPKPCNNIQSSWLNRNIKERDRYESTERPTDDVCFGVGYFINKTCLQTKLINKRHSENTTTIPKEFSCVFALFIDKCKLCRMYSIQLCALYVFLSARTRKTNVLCAQCFSFTLSSMLFSNEFFLFQF